jgi:Fic family protein
MRTYERTHPWISFRVDLNQFSHRIWLMLGEAESKCHHLAGVPLAPPVARLLHEIYLSKGIHGTTSIEGNTLSEEEVLALIHGELELPKSREYLAREVENVLSACNSIVHDVEQGRRLELTPDRIKHFNKMILDGLEVGEDVVPGELRQHSVGVLNYRGAPAEDCEHLLERLCRWLDGDDFHRPDNPDLRFTLAMVKAILAHLYIAWIHPFGDGNGRTARLIEFQLLVQAGVPVPAAHLLSDHYNLTRERYYIELQRTSKAPYPLEHFVAYALQGFIDGIREQLMVTRQHQLQVTWENYVHGQFHDAHTPARQRQKHLVLDLPQDGRPVPRSKIPDLSPRLVRAYHDRDERTLSRDLNVLADMGLIRRVKGGVIANRAIISAFLPLVADPQ